MVRGSENAQIWGTYVSYVESVLHTNWIDTCLNSITQDSNITGEKDKTWKRVEKMKLPFEMQDKEEDSVTQHSVIVPTQPGVCIINGCTHGILFTLLHPTTQSVEFMENEGIEKDLAISWSYLAKKHLVRGRVRSQEDKLIQAGREANKSTTAQCNGMCSRDQNKELTVCTRSPSG